MGAEPLAVLGMDVSQGMMLALTGIAAGTLGVGVLTRYLKELLFQVDMLDPVTFAAMAALVAGVTAVACYVPARRATKVNPMTALRAE
jgi:putative ABC transport system permease protein